MSKGRRLSLLKHKQMEIGWKKTSRISEHVDIKLEMGKYLICIYLSHIIQTIAFAEMMSCSEPNALHYKAGGLNSILSASELVKFLTTNLLVAFPKFSIWEDKSKGCKFETKQQLHK